MNNQKLQILYTAIKQGSHEDFKIFFDTYFPHLVYYACRFIEKERAEDIVQDVFVWVWENKERVEMGDSFVSFLYQSVHNKILNLIKRDRMLDEKHAQIEISNKALEYFSSQNDFIDDIDEENRISELQKAIEKLPERGKMCIKLSYMYGLKAKEIAKLLNISPRTVEAHLHLSIKKLRSFMTSLLFF